MTEADVTKAIRCYLNSYHIFHWKQWQGPLSTPGVADIIGCLPGGRMLAIEVKRHGWQPPKSGKALYHVQQQQAFLDAVNNAGGIGFFASSVGQVEKYLRPVLSTLGIKDIFNR